MCLGETSKDWPAIALGHGQKVYILCGSAEGKFDQIGEEPSAAFITALDYVMNSNPNAPVPSAAVYQLQYWEPTQSLHVLWSDRPSEIARFNAAETVNGTHEGLPVADLHGRDEGHAFALHQARVGDGTPWSRIVVLVDGLDFTDISFAR